MASHEVDPLVTAALRQFGRIEGTGPWHHVRNPQVGPHLLRVLEFTQDRRVGEAVQFAPVHPVGDAIGQPFDLPGVEIGGSIEVEVHPLLRLVLRPAIVHPVERKLHGFGPADELDVDLGGLEQLRVAGVELVEGGEERGDHARVRGGAHAREEPPELLRAGPSVFRAQNRAIRVDDGVAARGEPQIEGALAGADIRGMEPGEVRAKGPVPERRGAEPLLEIIQPRELVCDAAARGASGELALVRGGEVALG
nr:hypothetical protein [Polyangium fumosum]